MRKFAVGRKRIDPKAGPIQQEMAALPRLGLQQGTVGHKKSPWQLPGAQTMDLTSKMSNQIWELLGRIYTLKAFFGKSEYRKRKK